jgi:hypothetical protein
MMLESEADSMKEDELVGTKAAEEENRTFG